MRQLIFDVSMLSVVDKAVTGISRVLFCLVREIQALGAEYRITGIDFNVEDGEYRLFSANELAEKFKPFVELKQDHEIIQKSINKGDVLVLLGEEWLYEGLMEKVASLKNQHGCEVVSMIHDFSPYLYPETFTLDFPENFKRCIQSQVELSDLLVVYSNSTKNDLIHFFPKVEESRIASVRLGSVFNDVCLKASPPIDINGEYILFVSTLQPRKNHGILLWVWRSLISKYGDSCPSLILAGKYGYGLDDFVYAVKANPDLSKKIKFVGQVDDNQLKELYARTLFTLYPSLYEGWGLPIAESLSKGKLCLASRNSSMTEISDDYVDYIDPNDSGQIFRKIASYLDDREMLARKNENIKEYFRPTSWEITAIDFLKVINKLG